MIKFRNYCIIVIGKNLANVLAEIVQVAESTPNIMDGKGLVIATFTSNVEPRELTEYFKGNNRSFMLFDLEEENSGVFIDKEEIHEGLFGFLKYNTLDMLNDKTQVLKNDIQLDVLKIKSGNTANPITITELSLEEQLQNALDKEDYLKAAKIRDKMGQK